MEKKTKIAAAVIGGVVALGAVGGGAWALIAHNTQQSLNHEYAQSLASLADSVGVLVEDSSSAEVLFADLAGLLGDKSGVSLDVESVVAPVGDLLSEVSETVPEITVSIPESGSVPVGVIVGELAAFTDGDSIGQSGDSQSGSAQSDDSQSGKSAESGVLPRVPLSVMLSELGFEVSEDSDDSAQSGDAQSGDSQSGSAQSDDSQSGKSAQSDDSAQSGGVVGFVSVDVLVGDVTREQVVAVESLMDRVGQASADVVSASADAVSRVYSEKLSVAVSAYEKAGEALDKKITEAEKLLKDSDGKVADGKTRDALAKAIESARGVAGEPVVETGVISDYTRGTRTQARKDLESAMKSVSDSVAEKTRADEEARIMAEQQAVSESYSDYSGGYDDSYSDYSGGGYSEPSYSGGGSSSGGSSSGGGNGYMVTGRPEGGSGATNTSKCNIMNGVPNEYC